MRIKIWGTRALAPVSGPEFAQYGFDTSCVEVQSGSGNRLVLDAGTGLGAMARATKDKRTTPVFCLGDARLDHIQGLPFYSPLRAGKTVIYGPVGARLAIERLFEISPGQGAIPPDLDIREIAPGARFGIGDLQVEAAPANTGSLVYRIVADGFSFVYSDRCEIPAKAEQNDLNFDSAALRFMEGSDLILMGASRIDEDQSTADRSDSGQRAKSLTDPNARRILLTNYRPEQTDDDIDDIIDDVRRAFPHINPDAARPGMVIENGGIAERPDSGVCPICGFFKKTAPLSDTHAVLDAILTEARRMGRADAGSVYLVQNGELVFSAAQNATLFPASGANKFFYMNSRISIDKTSIAGYAAATGKSLNIPDARELPPDSEYKFNIEFDKKSGYTTRSVLAVPLLNAKDEVIGVLQLINSRKNDQNAPFSRRMEKDIANLASMATVPLERSFLVRSMILRMLRTSSLRDPSETAGHVYRVGAMAAELYHRWAEHRGVDPEELLSSKGVLRLAAMLHDVGKVGIPDAVLKKPGKLDDAERSVMQKHAALGADLFDNCENKIDRVARDIALHHHAKWDGTGYTGDAAIISPSKSEIPIWARITAIVDVYDALVSRRCYKEAWDSEKAIEILQKDAGTHFDPELVRDFIEIKDIVDAIMRRYQ